MFSILIPWVCHASSGAQGQDPGQKGTMLSDGEDPDKGTVQQPQDRRAKPDGKEVPAYPPRYIVPKGLCERGEPVITIENRD